MSHRETTNGREYKIQWKGYSSKDDTWTSEKEIKARESIEEYWTRKKKDKAAKARAKSRR